MKKTVFLLLALLAVFSCYDDSALQETLREHDERISTLETLCAQLNTNQTSLQTIIDALDSNDYVTGVAPVMEGNTTIGYTLTFKKGGSVTIYMNNDKPELKIKDGAWYISYDEGKTWEKVGDVTPGTGDAFIADVEVDGQYVTLTLSDGQTVIKVPLVNLPPVMALNQGYKVISFRGKAVLASIDYTVGVYVAGSEEMLLHKIRNQRGLSTGYFEADGTFEVIADRSVEGYDDFGSFEEGTTKYCMPFVRVNGVYSYSDMMTFTIDYNGAEVTSEVNEVTVSSAKVSGHISLEYPDDVKAVLRLYESSEGNEIWETMKDIPLTLDPDNNFSVSLSDLRSGVEYVYYILVDFGSELNSDIDDRSCFTFTTEDSYDVESELEVSKAIDLSSSESANCYIISESGLYKFKPVKGNSPESVGNVTSARILWETFGTSIVPERFDLISGVCYKDGYIAFQTADTFKEGNAVIAAKDASGKILWSWHIWFTDEPQGQDYYNDAGTMMDRNLGATSATPGDVGALGLLYQWGRKDPFLGSSSISDDDVAKSTIIWPSSVESDSSKGTIAYATAHPTTFIGYNSNNYDWYYTGDSSTDNTRWTTSESSKSIYDPCPFGWRVPDGGSNGVWSKALGSSSYFEHTYSSSNEGMNFSGKFGSASTIWYPVSGCRSDGDGSLYGVGYAGYYWSASPGSYDDACSLGFGSNGGFNPSCNRDRADGNSVRCLQESK